MNLHTTPAEAFVDPGDKLTGGGERWWTVTVRTPPGWPRFHQRVYRVLCFTEAAAGQEGLERFAEEIDGHQRHPVLEI